MIWGVVDKEVVVMEVVDLMMVAMVDIRVEVVVGN